MNVTALDESGQPVDWWFIYKVPQLGAGASNDAATGYEYVYYDSTIDSNSDPRQRNIIKSPNTLNSYKGALNLTLNAVFGDFKNPPPTTGWILYNDEMPAEVERHDDGSKGHTKGVIAFDTATKTAFWLLHSWPKFMGPSAVADPTPQYGQTYLCISLDLDTANAIAAQMADHQEPQVYFPRTADLPNTAGLYALSQPLKPNPPAASGIIDLKSKGGMPFKVIAKNREWNKDFWNELVGPTLSDDMDVETWIRGKIPPTADSDGIHKTFDIKYINLGKLGAHWAWPETHDHAKWGITLHLPWVCVGDINRMISQQKRGGGTIAFQNQNLWAGLSKTDLVLAPPGSSRTDAIDIIQQTHKHTSEAPPKAPVPSS
ncbi:deoxyribonuclease II family protein [Mucilaginibacter sp. X4EP1]|uniref:deoxyribonuclease II family protein n=1 Tax=Mucilaginibacter sp. X4EP1 TaxID=2723092 RepID=UPI00216781CF|nr:deoxyribonuclease II family protein [Mucilaginibacter sp. X4EP1]MCS3813565.1 deoxyribonuclease-2 [Mucilaginibacter sp. X4EP1]